MDSLMDEAICLFLQQHQASIHVEAYCSQRKVLSTVVIFTIISLMGLAAENKAALGTQSKIQWHLLFPHATAEQQTVKALLDVLQLILGMSSEPFAMNP